MTQACQAWPVCIIRLSQAHSESDLQVLEGPRPPNHSPMLWFVVVMYSLSHAQLFATPWTMAHQTLLSITISRFAEISCPLSQ